MHRAGIYEKFIKRGLDLLISGCALLVLWPVLLVLVVLVRSKLGNPAIFCQERPGKNGRVFRLYKLRTMTDERDEDGRLLPDEVRLTPFGRTLRSLSLDELPELWNIFRGDMSLVGPRPLLVKYLPLYNAQQARRHEVMPGLTGWAQVNGRNLVTWEDKFTMDVWYVDHISFALDLKILWLTVKAVLRREGISAESSATMEEFQGSEERVI